MKNKKLNILFVSLFVVVLILVSLILIIKNDRAEKSNPTGVGDTSYDDFYNWETNLNIDAIKLFNDMYSKDYEFEFNDQNEYQVTIEALQNRGMDVSSFNTDDIFCDLEKSFIKVYYENGEQIRSVHMECIKN